jgi:hypothetical protein
MATLNEMIAQGAQFNVPDPTAQYNKLAQMQRYQQENELARYTMAKAQQEDVTRNALNQAYQSNMNPETGEINYAGVYRNLGAAGAGASIPGIQKTQFEAEKEKQLLAKTRQETFGLQNKAIGSALITAMNDPSDAGLNQAFNILDSQKIDTKILRSQLLNIQDPAKRLAAIRGYATAHPEGIAAMKFVAPDPLEITKGDGSKIFVDKNPNSPTFKQEILPSQAAGMTPYQTQTLGISRQNLGVAQGNLSVARQRLAQDAQGVTYQQDAQGNIIALPSRLVSGGAPVARAVAGEGGAPVKGKLSAFAEKTAAQKAQLGKDLATGIKELENVTKDGGLIDQSTGSGVGRLVDVGARFVGQAMPGDIAIGKLKPIADLPLKLIPRFEGPQSDKDTTSYNAAAGQLADPTLPTKIRKEAGKTVLRLLKERQGQFVTSDMATEGVAPAPAAAAGGVVDFGSLR